MKNKKDGRGKWTFIILFLIALSVVSFIVAGIIGAFAMSSTIQYTGQGNVAVIAVKGMITVDQLPGFAMDYTAASTEIVSLIEEASENPRIEAIILDINSQGGSPVGSDEIAQAVKKTNKTTVSVIRELGASGAYWIASASDHVIANRMSITGSIGVVGSYLEFSGLDRKSVV